MVEERKCPLCGSDQTHIPIRYEGPDREKCVDLPFEHQECDFRSCGLPCRFWDQVEGLRAEIERLRPTVDTSKTADGVPVRDGMTLYFHHPESGEICRWTVTLRPSVRRIPSTLDDDDSYVYTVGECYSTPEAAHAAEKKVS